MQSDFVPKEQGEKTKTSFISYYAKFVVASFLLFCFVISSIVILKNRDIIENKIKPGEKIEGGSIKQFQTYVALLSFMEENASSISNSEAYRKSSAWGVTNSLSVEDSSAGGWGAVAPSGASQEEVSQNSDYSATNVQVEGVDEGDIMKTDGNYIYTANGNNVLLIDAIPAEEMHILAEINLSYTPLGIYVSGNKLAIYGNNYSIHALKDYEKISSKRNTNYTELEIYDISDKGNPKKEKSYSFEGNYQESRVIGDYLYMITVTSPVYLYYDEKQPVPYVLEDGEVLAPSNVPSVYYFDFPYTDQNFTSVAAVNIMNTGEDLQNSTYVLDGNQNNIYVSENNIYVTFSKYVSEEELLVEASREIIIPRLDAKDRERISEIESAKSYVLSGSEKSSKISAIFEKYYSSLDSNDRESLNEEIDASVKAKYKKISSEMQKTVIHKIGIDKGSLNYKNFGEVSGRVLNQFAMDESDGYFRIATTVDSSWTRFVENTKSYNNLYILDADMKKVGSVEDIAEGEQIYSVRFMQNRAYMVTFRRTDPLFVIDLKDPARPEILGKLKVPGYSTYLHPYDENLLIGLGKNADEDGRETGGVKLSLFDATEVENPKEIDTYILGGTGTESVALSDHKAFLFSKEKNLLVIPVVLRDVNTNSYSYEVLDLGSAVFKVDKSGFEYRNIISHKKNDSGSSYYYYFGNGRNLYIGDNLYSISSDYLKANKLEDLSEIKSIELPGSLYRYNDLMLPE